MSEDNSKGRKPDLIAYTVRGEGEKAFWNRIGAAWTNKDGGHTIQLDSLPIDGRIVCRPPKEEAA